VTLDIHRCEQSVFKVRGVEISVNMDIRMAISFEGDGLIVLLDVDHHDKPLK
jgi:hypothetical protein